MIQSGRAGLGRRLLLGSTGGALLAPVAVSAAPAAASAEPMLITADNVNGASGGLVIDRPGSYLLAGDVDWRPSHPNARAITIAADDVTLDLGGHLLRQVGHPEPERRPAGTAYKGEVVSGNVGVWAEGRSGIVVRNGSVRDVQGVGVALKDCHHVDLDSLAVRGCGGRGVVDTSFLFRNGGIFVMGTKAADGTIAFASDLRMTNCVCTANASDLDFVVTLGSLVLFCDNVRVVDCVFNRTANTSPQPSGVQFNVVGIDFVVCRNVLVADCEANDNTSGGEPAGFFAWGENYKFERCRAHRNHTLTGNRACGFNVSTTSNLEMTDCEADGNYNANPAAAADAVRDFSATGFRIGRAVYRALIERCRAIGNHSLGKNAPASGFMLNSATDTVLKDCAAIGNRNAGGGLASGFHLVRSQPDGKGGLVGGARNSLIDCLAQGNTTARVPLFVQPPAPPVDAGEELRGDPASAAGFLLDGQDRPTLVGCRALGNNGRGIWLRGCRGVVAERNLTAGNALRGLDDDAPAGPGSFADNADRLDGEG